MTYSLEWNFSLRSFERFFKFLVQSQLKHVNLMRSRGIASSSVLCIKFSASLRQDEENPPSGTSGGKGPGKGKDGQLCCPKCGKPCTHVETFVCKCALCYFLPTSFCVPKSTFI